MALKELASAAALQRDILIRVLGRLNSSDSTDDAALNAEDGIVSDEGNEVLGTKATDKSEINFEVRRFQNIDNYKKYSLFYLETGVTTMVKTLRWLYKGPRVENCMVEMSKEKLKAEDRAKLAELQDGTMKLADFDITFLFKIIKSTCGLSPENDPVWTKHCSMLRRTELEYLLYALKDGRNNVAHPGTIEKNLTLSDVRRKREEMEDLLTSIIKKAGEKAKIDGVRIDNVITCIKDDLDRILLNKSPRATISVQARMSLDRSVQSFLKLFNKSSRNSKIFGLPIQNMNLINCYSSELIFLGHKLKFLITPNGDPWRMKYASEVFCLEFANFYGKGTAFTIHESIEVALTDYALQLIRSGLTSNEEIRRWVLEKENSCSDGKDKE